MNVRWFVSNSY